jgi:hypothetical protein
MSLIVPTLQASVPGFLGVLRTDPGLRSLWRFEERADTIAPTDDMVVVEDTRPAPTFPAVGGDGYTGPARVFDGAAGVAATDPGELLLQRSLTVVALLSWDHASASGAETIVARGARGSAVERRAWQLRLTEPVVGTGRIAWVWEDRAGVEYVQDGGDFFLPASGLILLTATREWAGDRFLLRYWIGATLLAEHESTDMEVGGGLDGTLTIGCVGDGGGSFEEHLHGTIDQLAIFGEAFSQARVSNLWSRISYWQPGAYATLCATQPPGKARSRDDASNVRRRIRVQAGALGVIAADIALRQDAGLPDRAWGAQLEAWERTTGLSPRPTQTIAERQAAVVAALRGAEGLSADAILANLAPLYGLDEADLEIIRYDNVTRGVDYPAWDERGAGAVLIDGPDDEVTLQVPAGAAWSTVLGDYAYLTDIGAEPVITATVEATTLSNDDLFVGLVDGDGDTLAGVRLDTSATNLINTISGATIAAYVLPVTIRVFLDGDTVKAKVNGGADVTLGAAPDGLTHAEVALIPTTSSVPGAARSARVSDLRVINYDSRSTQVGYVYADTATDILSARRQLLRQQPAHAHCAALVGKRAVVCDDVLHGSDIAPCAETARDYLVSWFPGVSSAWAGNEEDLVSGELLTAAGAATINADVPHDGPFGDQALVLTEGGTDTWTMPAASSCNFTGTATTVLVLVYYLDSFTLGTEYTLIGNREGAELNGVEVAIDTSGNLVVRFDAGVGAPTEISLLPASTATGLIHTLVVKYDHDADLITAVTELQVGTAAFAASASSATAMALGAYRALDTPSWRCPLVKVFEGDVAAAIDPVATARNVHRVFANYPGHADHVRLRLAQGIDPDFSWSSSSIDNIGRELIAASGGATFAQVSVGNLAGPFALSLAGGSQSWIANDTTIGHLDTDRSTLIVACVDVVSFGGGFETICGDQAVFGDAGWFLGLLAGLPTFALDDTTSGVATALLGAPSGAAGKHVYLARWNATTQQGLLASELASNTLNFAGRTPVNTDAFRIGQVHAGNSVNFRGLHFAILYTDAFNSLTASQLVALAAALHAEI